jgi:splicing factor 3A subunit 3
MSELPPSVFAGAKGKGKGKRKREREAAVPAASGASASSTADADEQKRRDKDVAWLEFEITQWCGLMDRVVEQTKIQIEKKQTRTMEELEAELEAEGGPQDGDSDSDDEEKAIYNPKNLPLGWDGKPIPYWLYKLHGLNIEYNCEICGNYKYYGPRAFDRHFSEWRHTHGLKCLGICTLIIPWAGGAIVSFSVLHVPESLLLMCTYAIML